MSGPLDINTIDLDDARDRVLARYSKTPDDLVHDCLHGHYEASWKPGGPCINELESEEAFRHPFAPESDDPDTRCGDCNMHERHKHHDGMGVDTRYLPEEETE